MDENILQKIAGAVGNYAPGIAAILAASGVGAPIAGAVAAVGSLAKSFGLPADAKAEDVLSAVSTDPEIRLKAMIAENDFQAKMREYDLQELKAILQDIQNARGRQTDHEKVTTKSDINLYLLAWVIVGGFLILMGLMFKYTVPQDQNGVVFMLFGALASGFGSVLSYFFGSNKSSENKTNMLYNSVPTNSPKKNIEG